MSGSYRKRIRLADWDYSQSSVYMVTVCIADRTNRLGHITDADDIELNNAGRMIQQEILRLPETHPQIVLDEFVVMPNHVHLLLGLNTDKNESNPLALGKVIGEFKSRSTTRYIKGVKMGLLPSFDRHLWQIDFYETIMRNERWTEERRQYIINNPANWRDDPEMDTKSR